MRFFKKRKQRYKGLKKLPFGVVIILTKNNQEELGPLLKHIVDHPLFEQERRQVIIIDQYSYDNTIEIAKDFVSKYPNKIHLTHKVPRKSVFTLMKPYLSDPLIEIIQLDKLYDDTDYIPPKEIPNWVEKVKGTLPRNKQERINAKQLIERMELDRANVYTSLRTNVLDSLTHIEMQLKEINQTNLTNSEIEDAIKLLEKTFTRFRAILSQFDPDLFKGKNLYANLSGYLMDFTERTQINCLITQTGIEKEIEPYIGISLMRMIHDILGFLKKYHMVTEVDIRIKWGIKNITIRIKEKSKIRHLRKIDQNDLFLIDERATILGGYFREKKRKRDSGSDFFITLPISPNKDDSHEIIEK